MIYVVGCPSGGTSAVAGMLSIMGVSMKRQEVRHLSPSSADTKSRGGGVDVAKWWHETHECHLMLGLLDEYWQMNTPFPGWNTVRARSIVDTYKRARSKEDGLVGVKDVRLGALLCDAHPSPNDIIIAVDRSVESSYRSWVRRAVRLGTKQQFDHASFVVQCHWFKDHLASQHPCIRVSYEELLDDPDDTASFLAISLKLDESKCELAADSIRNYKGESFA